jgi:hypothetical protein
MTEVCTTWILGPGARGCEALGQCVPHSETVQRSRLRLCAMREDKVISLFARHERLAASRDKYS